MLSFSFDVRSESQKECFIEFALLPLLELYMLSTSPWSGNIKSMPSIQRPQDPWSLVDSLVGFTWKFCSKHISCHRINDGFRLLSIYSRQSIWLHSSSSRISNQELWQSQSCSSFLLTISKHLVLVQSWRQVHHHLCRSLEGLIEVVWLDNLVCCC